MWKNKLRKTIYLTLLLPFLYSPCAWASTISITDQQLQKLESNLMMLEEINSQQQILLAEQESDLTIVSKQLMESQEQLKILEKDLSILLQQLNDAKSETNSAKNSLAMANKELELAKKSLKKLEKQENELWLWRLIVVGLGVALVK